MIKPIKKSQLYFYALDSWGKELQVNMFFEETAELQLLLARDLRGRVVKKSAIAEEIADVRLMLDQMAFIYSVEDEADTCFNDKLHRLAKRLDKEDVLADPLSRSDCKYYWDTIPPSCALTNDTCTDCDEYEEKQPEASRILQRLCPSWCPAWEDGEEKIHEIVSKAGSRLHFDFHEFVKGTVEGAKINE